MSDDRTLDEGPSERDPGQPAPGDGSGPGSALLLSSLSTLLVLVIIVMVNYISFRRYERWDWTTDGLFTLSDRTEKVVKGLKQDVDVYLFVSSSEPSFGDLQDLLKRYQALSERIVPHYVDPDRQPAEFKLYAKKFGVRAAMLPTGGTTADVAVIVAAGDKHWSITRDDFVEFDMDSVSRGPADTKIDIKTEQALTGALLQVTSGRSTRVCLSEGHGEWSVDDPERSLALMAEELRRDNLEMDSRSLREADPLEGCDAVYVIGPRKPFSDEELTRLRDYVSGGGNLLVALDPIDPGDGRPGFLYTGLEKLAAEWGVLIDPSVVQELDAARLLVPRPVGPFGVLDYEDHVVVRQLRLMKAPVVMELARSVRAEKGSRAEELMHTSKQGFAETKLEQLLSDADPVASVGDIEGPVSLAVAVSTLGDEEADMLSPGAAPRARKGGRVIVTGSSSWLGAYLGEQVYANIDLLATTTGWLTERDALVSIPPKKFSALRVLITEEGLSGIFVRVLLLLPMACLVLGVGVWWTRRS